MMDNNIITISELEEYCNNSLGENNVYVYINSIPVGFGVESIEYDFDGSIKLHVKDEDLKYEPIK